MSFENISLVMLMASGPDTLTIPIAPPCAVDTAQIVEFNVLYEFEVNNVGSATATSPKTILSAMYIAKVE